MSNSCNELEDQIFHTLAGRDININPVKERKYYPLSIHDTSKIMNLIANCLNEESKTEGITKDTKLFVEELSDKFRELDKNK